MVREILIWVEGGGNKDTRSRMREGFNKFLNELHDLAKSKGIALRTLPCGSGSSAYKDFKLALETYPNAFNVLLIDSEGPVNRSQSPRKYLQSRYRKWNFDDVDDSQCYLMVQMMEAWFIADIAALKLYYGNGFNESPLRLNPNVEEIGKKELEAALKSAVRFTKKSKYDKTRDAPKLLELLDATTVRRASRHCDHLFTKLAEKIGGWS